MKNMVREVFLMILTIINVEVYSVIEITLLFTGAVQELNLANRSQRGKVSAVGIRFQ